MKPLRLLFLLCLVVIAGLATKVYAQSQTTPLDLAALPEEQTIGTLESVAVFNDMMQQGSQFPKTGGFLLTFLGGAIRLTLP